MSEQEAAARAAAVMQERAELDQLEAAAEDRRDLAVRWRTTGRGAWSSARLVNVPAEVAGRLLHGVLLQVDPAGAEEACTCPPDELPA